MHGIFIAAVLSTLLAIIVHVVVTKKRDQQEKDENKG